MATSLLLSTSILPLLFICDVGLLLDMAEHSQTAPSIPQSTQVANPSVCLLGAGTQPINSSPALSPNHDSSHGLLSGHLP
jgi:hypothetical protein